MGQQWEGKIRGSSKVPRGRNWQLGIGRRGHEGGMIKGG